MLAVLYTLVFAAAFCENHNCHADGLALLLRS